MRATRMITLMMVLVSLFAPSMQAFETDGAVLGFLGAPVHDNITREGLVFLKSDILELIVDQHLVIEAMQVSRWHFDNCAFSETTQNIKTQYETVLTQLNPDLSMSETLIGMRTFGQLLHPVQDFYAHSNWVEIGGRNIINSSLINWEVIAGGQDIEGAIVLQGSLPGYSVISANRVTYNVTVKTPDGETKKGLVTGTYDDNGNVDLCHPDASFIHGTIPRLAGNGLNKDHPNKLGYYAARALAVQQTSHEWCRLLSLVEQKYGVPGVKHLFDNLVEDKEGARAACSKDVVLIIDSTGSMSDNDPLRRRVEAAKVFIDTAPIGDRIAVVSFNTGATTLATLQEIKTVADRTALKQAVDAVDQSGNTNINAGLNSGFSELLPTGRALNIAILLTDGQHNVGLYDPNSHGQYTANDWPVYTIGLGGDTDPVLLGQIASETGGNYVALTASTQLQDLYHQISQRLAGGSQIYQQSTRMSQGDTLQTTIPIDEFRPSISFFTSWSEDIVSQQLVNQQVISGQVGNASTIRDEDKVQRLGEQEINTADTTFVGRASEISLSLVNPVGQVVEPTTTDPNVFHAKGATYELYIVRNPEAGQWTMNLLGSSLPASGANVNLNVSVTGAIDKLFLPLVASQASASCSTDGVADSNNVADAITTCNGGISLGQVSIADRNDVYKIALRQSQQISIVLSGGNVGDADLYLYPPSTTDVDTDFPVGRSRGVGDDESIVYSATEAGEWYILVYSYAGATDYMLTITLSPVQ